MQQPRRGNVLKIGIEATIRIEYQRSDGAQLPFVFGSRGNLECHYPAPQRFHHVLSEAELCDAFVDVRERVTASHDLAHCFGNPGDAQRKGLMS